VGLLEVESINVLKYILFYFAPYHIFIIGHYCFLFPQCEQGFCYFVFGKLSYGVRMRFDLLCYEILEHCNENEAH
jgi:hypothetical protein